MRGIYFYSLVKKYEREDKKIIEFHNSTRMKTMIIAAYLLFTLWIYWLSPDNFISGNWILPTMTAVALPVMNSYLRFYQTENSTKILVFEKVPFGFLHIKKL